MKKWKVFLVVGGALFAIWLVAYTVQHWRWPRGPIGPAEAQLQAASYEEGWVLAPSIVRFAGSVDYVRIIATDGDIRAEFHTEQGWYSMGITQPTLVDRRKPLLLKFQYPKELPLRKETAAVIRVRSYFLGVVPFDWAQLGTGSQTVPGEVAQISVQLYDGNLAATVTRTTQMRSFGQAFGGRGPVEVLIYPATFP